MQKSFDVAGYLRGMQYPDGDTIGAFGGSGTALGYDEAGRLSNIPGILTSVTYNALGAPLVQTNANGTTTTKTYDADRFWLTTIVTTAPSLAPQDLVYTLNDAGMATAVTSPFATEGWTYAYDEMNRLTSSTNTGTPANDQTWTYDNIGRITNNSRVGNYTYSVTKPHAVTAAGSNAYGPYDPNGNLQIGGGRMLTWDANNQITTVSMGSSTTTFTYGPDGNRIKKALGANVSKYPFGDDYEIAPTGTVTKYFNAGFGVIAKKVGTTLYWLHTDRMGSINATTDGSGAEMLRRSYRSYGALLGEVRPSGGTHTESLGYIGQRTDTETGLTYLHARYYDPVLGVFLSPDPIGADRNSYRYAGGNPANMFDSSGLVIEFPGGVNCPSDGPPNCPDGGSGGWGGGGGGGGGDNGGCLPPAQLRASGYSLSGAGCNDPGGGPGGGGDYCAENPKDPTCPQKPDPPECDTSDPNGGCYVPPSDCPAGLAALNCTGQDDPPRHDEPEKPKKQEPEKVCQAYADTVMYDFVQTKLDIAAFSRQSSAYRWGSRAVSTANLFVGSRLGTSVGTALGEEAGRVTFGQGLKLYVTGASGSSAGLGYLAEGAGTAAYAAGLSYGIYNAAILSVSIVRSIPSSSRCH